MYICKDINSRLDNAIVINTVESEAGLYHVTGCLASGTVVLRMKILIGIFG